MGVPKYKPSRQVGCEQYHSVVFSLPPTTREHHTGAARRRGSAERAAEGAVVVARVALRVVHERVREARCEVLGGELGERGGSCSDGGGWRESKSVAVTPIIVVVRRNQQLVVTHFLSSAVSNCRSWLWLSTAGEQQKYSDTTVGRGTRRVTRLPTSSW